MPAIKETVSFNKRKLVKVNPGSKDHIIYDKDKCTNCGNCVMICSMSLWQLRDGKVQLAKNYKSYCLECASCFNVCESDAIKFTFPEAGYGVVYAHG